MKLMSESALQPTLRTATFRGRPPWLPALLAGALTISSGCSGAEPSEAQASSEIVAASTCSFERVLTAWDQPEEGWSGYALHVADVSGDDLADLVWNEL